MFCENKVVASLWQKELDQNIHNYLKIIFFQLKIILYHYITFYISKLGDVEDWELKIDLKIIGTEEKVKIFR